MDNRRLVLLLIFSFSIVMLWDAWQKHGQPKAVVAPASQVGVAGSAGGTPGAVPTPTAAPATAGAEAVPGAVAKVDTGAKAIIRTDLYVAEIVALGGDLVRLELVKHPDTNDKSKPFVLFDSGERHVYLGQSGIIGRACPTTRPYGPCRTASMCSRTESRN